MEIGEWKLKPSRSSHTSAPTTHRIAALGCETFAYRDFGIADATDGRVIAHLVKATNAPEKGTGWHIHEAEFHIVLMLKGWARFMYEDKDTLVTAGDCVHQAPRIRHFLFDYSEDMEYLEVVGPAEFKSIEVEGPCDVPAPTPWAP
ncbi:cupin domain-containing protein [Caballeronia novacaledonica]|uniref:Cupin domain-containing protein n=1 Tax=Caballeronia novacaledonica TaxID=1544861 RepID=A0AA37MQU8_9BURK|nr:cupin domain-containing protein [Caballeronia novacaledonica]